MHKKKIVGSAVVGNIVEYYDFGVYAVFAAMIGKNFFPMYHSFIQTISTFGVFALGFMMRPIGGIVFGYIGDKFGRKIALTISIIGMAMATFGIGILPTFEQIGIYAPMALILIRLFQGICIGGEGAGSAIFISEHLQGYKPGLIGSLVMASNMVGTLFATFIGIIINHFFGEDDFSWRYAFFLGGIMGLAGLYLRHGLDETPIFQRIKDRKKTIKSPIIGVVFTKWRRILVISCLAGVATSMAYTIRAYLNIFFSHFMGYDATESLYFTALCLFIFIITLPLFGLLSDKVGYLRFLKISCIAIIMLSAPVFQLLSNPEHDPSIVLLGLLLIGVLAASISAPAYPYAIQTFSPILRYSGVAFSWNIGNALFGGTTPAISTFLAEKLGLIAPAYYLVAMAILFLSITLLKKSDKY